MDQLPLSEEQPGRGPLRFKSQSARLARQVDEIEKLGSAKIPQISLKCHVLSPLL